MAIKPQVTAIYGGQIKREERDGDEYKMEELREGRVGRGRKVGSLWQGMRQTATRLRLKPQSIIVEVNAFMNSRACRLQGQFHEKKTP